MAYPEPLSPEWVASLVTTADPDVTVLLCGVLMELRELNTRLARAEAIAAGLAQGKNAKWFALFAKASGFGG